MGIINKSTHPVELKRIKLKVWLLRDEIEGALTRREKECKELGIDFNYDDIKEYYSRPSRFKYYMDAAMDPPSEDQDQNEASGEAPLQDASGNPLDEDALAMMSAMNEGSEEETPAQGPEEKKEENESSDPASTDDAAAAELAAQMLSGQGAKESTQSDEELKAKESKKLKQFERMPPEDDKTFYGFALLADINMKFMLVFCQRNFDPGQSIVVEFLIPKSFIMSAELISSTNMSLKSRIISASRPNYRLHTIFTYNQIGERDSLRSFLQSIEPIIPVNPKKITKAPDADDDDVDFDDLGL